MDCHWHKSFCLLFCFVLFVFLLSLDACTRVPKSRYVSPSVGRLVRLSKIRFLPTSNACVLEHFPFFLPSFLPSFLLSTHFVFVVLHPLIHLPFISRFFSLSLFFPFIWSERFKFSSSLNRCSSERRNFSTVFASWSSPAFLSFRLIALTHHQ